MLPFAPTTSANSSQEQLSKEAFTAIRDGNRTRVKELLSRGLDPNHMLGEPPNVLGLAVFYGEPDILSDLLHGGGNPHHTLEHGMYLVNFAAYKDEEALRVLLDYPLDLNALMYFDQFTAFTAMAGRISPEMIDYVLKNSNADVNYKPPNGYSALYAFYVREDCGLKCLEVLVEHCADPDRPIRSDDISFREHLVRSSDGAGLEIINDRRC